MPAAPYTDDQFQRWAALTDDDDRAKFEFYMDNCANMDVAVNRRFDAMDRPDAIDTLEYRFHNRTDASIELTALTINVTVRAPPDGSWGSVRRHELECIDPAGTVGALKDAVAAVFGLFDRPNFRIDRLRLTCRGRELANEKTLSSYGTADGDIIIGLPLGGGGGGGGSNLSALANSLAGSGGGGVRDVHDLEMDDSPVASWVSSSNNVGSGSGAGAVGRGGRAGFASGARPAALRRNSFSSFLRSLGHRGEARGRAGGDTDVDDGGDGDEGLCCGFPKACCLLFWAFAATLTFLIVMPLSFQYVEVNHIGLLYNTYNFKLDGDTVYPAGRYAFGPGREMVTFPTFMHTVDFDNPNPIKVYSRTGTPIQVETSLQYRIEPENVPDVWAALGSLRGRAAGDWKTGAAKHYEVFVRQKAISILANTATKYSTLAFYEQRRAVSADFRARLATGLAEYGFTMGMFQLKEIRLPEAIREQNLLNVVTYQARNLAQFQQQAISSLSDIKVVNRSAIADASIVIQGKQSEGFVQYEAARSEMMYSYVQREVDGYKELQAATTPDMSKDELLYKQWTDTWQQTDSQALLVNLDEQGIIAPMGGASAGASSNLGGGGA